MTQDARSAILNRVRQALSRPAPEPHGANAVGEEGPLFPLPASDETSCRDRFRSEFEAIHGEWIDAASFEAAKGVLRAWLSKNELRRVLAIDKPLLRTLLSELGDNADIVWAKPDASQRRGWEALDVGITGAESLVAESGTIVVSSGMAGRAPSVLPPVHLVVAFGAQLVPDLETSMQRLRTRYGAQLPSTISWISGPSRTADIEKILVLGAHGPRRLAVLYLPGAMPAELADSNATP